MNSRNILIYFSVIYQGDYEKIYDAITKREAPTEEAVNETLKTVTSPCLTILDEDYPEYLKQKTVFPPFVLYYYGDISLIKDETKNIAFIGSRECSDYGAFVTNKLVSQVSEKFNIVSGLARGIDSCAHRACINKIGKTIAVLGSGIDYCYPPKNIQLYKAIKKKGLIISEYPGKTPPLNINFPRRNRIIVALSRAVVITEAKLHSGTQISTNYALLSGKDVCCVPYPIDHDSLCNALIKEGAFLIESVQDLYAAIGYREDEPLFAL